MTFTSRLVAVAVLSIGLAIAQTAPTAPSPPP